MYVYIFMLSGFVRDGREEDEEMPPSVNLFKVIVFKNINKMFLLLKLFANIAVVGTKQERLCKCNLPFGLFFCKRFVSRLEQTFACLGSICLNK